MRPAMRRGLVLALCFAASSALAQGTGQPGMSMTMPWGPPMMMQMSPYGGPMIMMGPYAWGPTTMPGMPTHGSMMVDAGQPLTVEQARRNLEFWLNWTGNARLRPGAVVEQPDGTLLADIVTPEGSLAQRYQIDRRTGWYRQVP